MDNLVVSTKKQYTSDKMFAQVKIIANNNIKSIISVNVQPVVISSECTNNILSLSGKFNVTVVYISAENQIEKAESIVDFIEKQKADFSLSSVVAKVSTNIDNINFSSNEAMVYISYTALVSGVYNYQLPIIEENANLVFNKKSFNFANLVSNTEDTFTISEQFEINQNISEIINVTPSIKIKDIACTVDRVVLDGMLIAEILYKENDSILKAFKEIEFKQEISAKDINPNMLAEYFVDIKSVSLVPEVGDEKTLIVATFDIFAKIYIYEDKQFEIINDMFSLNKEISTSYNFIEAKSFGECKQLEENTLSVTDISEYSDFDDIVSVYNPIAEVQNIDYIENYSNIHLKITATALYKTENGYNSLNIEHITVLNVDSQNTSSLINVNAQIVSFKVKAGKELEVVFKCDYNLEKCSCLSEKYVSAFDEISEKSHSDAGIKVYITKEGQSLFDIAKILNVKPDVILNQNEINDVFEQGEKIYVYSPVNLA